MAASSNGEAYMIKRVFRDHPHSVGETYPQHFRAAAGFGFSMMVGGVACLLHAIIPSLFETTGSRTVGRLHRTMIADRGNDKGQPD